jgi:hypothetical protein
MSLLHQQMGMDTYSLGGVDAAQKSPIARRQRILFVKLRLHLSGRFVKCEAPEACCLQRDYLFIFSLEHSSVK